MLETPGTENILSLSLEYFGNKTYIVVSIGTICV